ncbi:MFS transporter [Luteimicrobium subarcticum]|uniref:MFS transporter n=1 Tax=Luteimicrobium subarcticum TaxID=620910 RepID=A0A2M8WT60_9MICO|nr:MFS transporter [Luteimicrobium subarcticum]PJI94120.1 MFS transporter [Luteimicrobium subarcticum]
MTAEARPRRRSPEERAAALQAIRDRYAEAEPPPAQSQDRRQRRGRVSSTVVTLGIVSLLTDISSESVAAVLPLYITASLGMTTVAYGFIDGLMQGAPSLMRIVAGWMSDKRDHPKRVAALGYALSAATRAILLLSTSLAAVTATVAIDRVGKGIRTAPRDAMIAASSDPRTIGRSFGVHRALDTAGSAIGPLLAFVVLWLIPGGYRNVFVISFGVAVIGVGALVLLVPDLRPRRAAWLERHRSRVARGLPKCKNCTCGVTALAAEGAPTFSWTFLRGRELRRILTVSVVLGLLTVGDGFIYLSLQAKDGFATQWFPLLYVGTNVAYMTLAVPAGRLADKVGRAKVLVWGHVALVGAYLCAGASVSSTSVTLLALLLLGIFYATTDGVLAALVGRLIATESRASAIGTAQSAVDVSRLVASSAFGILWFTIGRSEAVLTVACLLAAAVPAAAYALRHLDAPGTSGGAPDEGRPQPVASERRAGQA